MKICADKGEGVVLTKYAMSIPTPRARGVKLVEKRKEILFVERSPYRVVSVSPLSGGSVEIRLPQKALKRK